MSDPQETVGPESGDVVVAVAKQLWRAWIAEGSLAGVPSTTADEFCWTIGRNRPKISPGGRVYVVAFGRLRGYAPLLRIDDIDPQSLSLVRGAEAYAVTIDEPIRGFQGWRYRWWPRSAERAFPDWQYDGVPETHRVPQLGPVTDDALREIAAALARDDLRLVCQLLQQLRFSPRPGAFYEDAALTAIVDEIAPRGRKLWEKRMEPFLVAVGAASSEAAAIREVVPADFDAWIVEFSVNWLREAASKAQRFNPQYLTEICFGGIRTAFAERLWGINIDTHGALMEKVAGARLHELESEFGREALLQLAHRWVWLELWFAYNQAQQKRTTLDLAAIFVDRIRQVVRARNNAGIALSA